VQPVHFTYGFPEFRAVYRARLGVLAPRRWARILFFLGLYVLILGGWIVWTYGLGGLQYLLIPGVLRQVALWMGIIVAACIAIPFVFQEIALRFAVRRAAAMNQPVAVTLTDGGIDIVGPSFTVTYRWDAIGRVHADRDHLLLFTGGYEAVPIPRRAVGSDAAFEALLRYARERMHG
jgi:hypothetical protein